MNIKPLRIDIEPKFCMNSVFMFVPDVAVYSINGLSHLFEVVNTNPISEEKLKKINYYFDHHGYWPEIIEISAIFILNRLKV